MFAFLIIVLFFLLATPINAQMPTPIPSATPASSVQINQAPTATPAANAAGQSTPPPAQSSHEVVLGRSYKDIQDNYRKIQEQKKLAQEQQIQAARTQAAAKAATTSKTSAPKNTSTTTSSATASTISPQEYYWQQQLERQQRKAGIQTPESVSNLERKTYAGLTKTQVKPVTEKSTIKKPVAQAPQAQSTVQEEVSLARKKAAHQQKKRRKKIGRARRLHPKKQKTSTQTSPATTTGTQDQTAQTKDAQVPNQ